MNLKIKDRVKEMLEKYPYLRDSDERLLANLWHYDCERKGITELSGFLRHYSTGDMTNSESVRRSRQKIQEDFPELRGKSYNPRHKHTEKVKKELGYPTRT